jgi:hypothetical protein
MEELMFSLRSIIITAAALSLSVGAASAEDPEITKVNKPKWKGYALDWCLTWATDCGKPAADKWCQSGGYDKSVGFAKWNDIGQPTRVIGSNQVCDEQACDSFLYVTCTKEAAADDDDDDEASSEEVTYSKPMAGGRRLDWCLTWAVDCGKPAADYYCKKKGHSGVVNFAIAEDIGKTRILKTNQKCTEPICDGFKFITCTD